MDREGGGIFWKNILDLLTAPKCLSALNNVLIFKTYKFLLDPTLLKFCGRCSRKFH